LFAQRSWQNPASTSDQLSPVPTNNRLQEPNPTTANLPPDILNLNLNPYESPEHLTSPRTLGRSRTIYWAITLAVLAVWTLIIGLLAWSVPPTLEDGQIWINIPGEVHSTTPSGDRFVAYDRQFYVDTSGVLILLTILVSLSLAFANGLVFFWRLRKRRT